MPHVLNHSNHPVVKEFRNAENLHARNLAEQHESLELQLAEERSRPSANEDIMKTLKVRKLHLAQQLERLRQPA